MPVPKKPRRRLPPGEDEALGLPYTLRQLSGISREEHRPNMVGTVPSGMKEAFDALPDPDTRMPFMKKPRKKYAQT